MRRYTPFILAALLIVSALAGCAEQSNISACPISSISGRQSAEIPADSAFSSEDFEKLMALRFDGYEEMTVAEFRNKVMAAADTKEYLALFDRLSRSTAIQDTKDTEEAAAFIFYTLMPLTDDTWREKSFSGAAVTDDDAAGTLEYSYTLAVVDENALTIGEYNDAQAGIASGLQTCLDGQTAAELQNAAVIQAAVEKEAAALTELWNTDKLHVELEYAFRCENPLQHEEVGASGTPASDAEPRRAEHGTQEDYAALLVLKTADYAKMSVADFNSKLLQWADDDIRRMERIDADTLHNDFQVPLTEEERSFVRRTVFLSGLENGVLLQSSCASAPPADPAYQESLPQKTGTSSGGFPLWCDLGYRFSYHIADPETLTVEQRDRCIGGLTSAIEEFWNEMTLEGLQTVTKGDIDACLTGFAAENSDDGIVITIDTEKTHFEHTGEMPEVP